jgi:hypothetical protein
MKLEVKRLGDNGDTTIGAFYINGILKCFTIEDQEQKEGKVRGETRIPEGTYNVSLRKEGGYHAKYTKRYADIHKGMLCIHNAPDWKIQANGMEFQYILIHTGNTDEHTMGCLLLNYSVDANSYIGANSGGAYKALYPEIANALHNGEEVTITYTDIEDGK